MSLPENYTALLVYGKKKDYTIQQVPLQKPSKNQILIKMGFAPLNPTEILAINGEYPLPTSSIPHRIGFEGSGTVVAVGEDLQRPFQVGDQVHVLVMELGTLGQYVLANSDKCRKVEHGLSLEEAASHFTNPATVGAMAHYTIKSGHKAVINTAGSSPLGRMLASLFKYKGIKVISVVRKDDFIEELKKDGTDYVLNSQSPDFEEQLKEIAHRENATLALDAVAGDLSAKVLRSQPEGSVIAIYGLLGGADLSSLNVKEFIFDGKTLTGFHVAKYLAKLQPEEAAKVLDEVYELLPTVLKTTVQKVFELHEVGEALEFIEGNSSRGKTIVRLN